MFSFHATKIYHSVEGGMLCFGESRLRETFDYLKNFGFENEVEVVMPGANANMNEFQALMGEMNLASIDRIVDRHRTLCEHYRSGLKDIHGIQMVPGFPEGTEPDYAYMPVEIDEDAFGVSRDGLYRELKRYNIFTRRYLYPRITDLACYRSVVVKEALAVDRKVASRILALPIYEALRPAEVDGIVEIIS